MRFILQNLKKYRFLTVAVIVLLLLQAVCDLLLPTITSDLIDTGIKNNGIETAVPLRMTQADALRLSLFMTEDEQALLPDLQKDEDGILCLTDEDVPEETEEALRLPLYLMYTLEESDVQGYEMPTDSQLSAMNEEELAQAKTEAMRLRESMTDEISLLGDSILQSGAIAETVTMYARADGDADALRSRYLWEKGGIMIAAAIGMAVISILLCYVSSLIGAGVGRDMRERVFSRVLSFSHAETDRFSTASLITRTTNDIQHVQFITVMLLRIILYAPVMAIGGIVMVMRTCPGMSWIIGLALVLMLAILGVLGVFLMPKFKIMQKLVDGLNRISRELLSGVQVIRAFGREKEEEQRFDAANTDLMKTSLYTGHAMSLLMPMLNLMMYGFSALIIRFSAPRIDAGTLQVGQMTAYITYSVMVVAGFLMVAAVFVFAPRAIVAANRIKEVIDTVPVIADDENPEKTREKGGCVRFDNVGFRYPGAKENTVSGISFTAKPGTVTAIVGGTGSGKTTLLSLLERFYDVTEGSITLDGTDIRKITMHDLREKIGYVPQKGILFTGSIADNIGFGAADRTEENIRLAAEVAQASDFIEEKPEAYDSFIAQGGSNVSGGQKQRLSIARAVAKKPRVYLFDDSFSALDYKTDAALRKALHTQVGDAAVIIVAQRIGTVLHADNILVLEDGKTVGQGTHAELMRHCDVYREIAVSQLGDDAWQNTEGGASHA